MIKISKVLSEKQIVTITIAFSILIIILYYFLKADHFVITDSYSNNKKGKFVKFLFVKSKQFDHDEILKFSTNEIAKESTSISNNTESHILIHFYNKSELRKLSEEEIKKMKFSNINLDIIKDKLLYTPHGYLFFSSRRLIQGKETQKDTLIKTDIIVPGNGISIGDIIKLKKF